MITCGIELKASEAIFTVLKAGKGEIIDITGGFKKIKLENDSNCKDIRSLFETIKNHFDSNNSEE